MTESTSFIDKEPNQLKREFLSFMGLNAWAGCNSASRQQMYGSHITQRLVISDGNERYCQTGMEREFAKYTFSVKMPCNGLIVKVIPRYRQTIDKTSIAFSPETVVIYEDMLTKQIGHFILPRFCSNHPQFGFEYKPTKNITKIVPGTEIPEGTIFLDSPCVTEDGGYKYGIELNIALMSMPGTSEDGVIICEDVLPRLTYKTYETRTVSWGMNKFALNLYGNTDGVYKPFPDIGEKIRDDCILMALREYDDLSSPVTMSKYDCTEPDFVYDKLTYATQPGGRIVDIRIIHPEYNSNYIPTNQSDEPLKYHEGTKRFYNEILHEYHRIKKDRGINMNLTRSFHRLVVEALTYVGDKGPKVTKLYRKTPIDTYRIEFTIEHDNIPLQGNKITDLNGGQAIAILM